MTELAGVMVGNYFLLECLSREGMVETYRARPTTRGGYDVILRLYRPQFPDPTGFHDHFATEVKKVWRCQHQHIQPLLEYGAGEDLLYSVSLLPETEETLEALLKHQQDRLLPLPLVMRFVTQVCAALQYAHEHDIVHGNIQPSSILIHGRGDGEDGEDREDITLTNFSMRRAYQDGDPLLAEIDMGNAAYMAPEQSLGIVRQASDIYALGLLLFRLLTSHLPFDGDSPEEIAMQHTDEPIPSLRALRPELPEALELVVRVALSKSPDARFPSAAALAQALISAIIPDAPQVIPDEPERRVQVRPHRTRFAWTRMASMLTLLVLLFGLVSASFFVFSLPQPLKELRKLPFWNHGYTATPGSTASTIPGTAPPLLTPTIGNTNPGTNPVNRATPTAHTTPTPAPGSTVGPTPTVSNSSTPTPVPAPSSFTCTSGTLSVVGSLNLSSLLQHINSDYQATCSGMSVTMRNSGDRRILNAVQQNQVGIAVSELTALPQRSLTNHPFAASLYALIVSPDVQISGLSSGQIQGIYTGKITNWSQVGGPNEAITVILRPASDAITAVFRTIVLNGSTIHVRKGTRLRQDTPDLVVQMVSQVPGAISMVPLVAAQGRNVQTLAIDGNLPTTDGLLAATYPFWSVVSLYTQGTGTAQVQSYVQFATSWQEAGAMSQFGAVPVSKIPQTVLASHLPGPEI